MAVFRIFKADETLGGKDGSIDASGNNSAANEEQLQSRFGFYNANGGTGG